MTEIMGLTQEEIRSTFEDNGFKKFRGTQVYEWMHRKRVFEFEAMTSLSQTDRSKMAGIFNLDPLKQVEVQKSKDGTVKFFFELSDGRSIETVLMPQSYGNSVCITSQVGCNMGCTFCASGLMKKERDLTPAEMVAQVLYVQKYLDKKEKRVTHIVIMGIGEPLDNFDNVKKFVDVINEPKGLAIGVRHITVSTSGLADKIIELANWDKRINLAVSLHSAFDDKRSKLMPINNAHNITELTSALKYYENKTNRRITFEYIMLRNFNDTEPDAIKLAKLCKNLHVHVNLIPYNDVMENNFRKSPPENVKRFFTTLQENGVNATIRREFGSDIDAACGQLRAKKEGKL